MSLFSTLAFCGLVAAAETSPPLDLKDYGILAVAVAFLVAGRVVPGKSLVSERKDRKDAEERERELLKDEAKVLLVAIDKANATATAFDAAASSLIALRDGLAREQASAVARMESATERMDRIAGQWEREWGRHRDREET